jgi:hypothetical protein
MQRLDRVALDHPLGNGRRMAWPNPNPNHGHRNGHGHDCREHTDTDEQPAPSVPPRGVDDVIRRGNSFMSIIRGACRLLSARPLRGLINERVGQAKRQVVGVVPDARLEFDREHSSPAARAAPTSVLQEGDPCLATVLTCAHLPSGTVALLALDFSR